MADGKLENRYIVTHKDGVEVDPNKQYFVIELTNPEEREAAAISAFCDKAEKTGYPFLAEEIRQAVPADLLRHDYNFDAELTALGINPEQFHKGEVLCELCNKPLKRICNAIDDECWETLITCAGGTTHTDCDFAHGGSDLYLRWPFIGGCTWDGMEALGFEMHNV
jgi:hypothetical protein